MANEQHITIRRTNRQQIRHYNYANGKDVANLHIAWSGRLENRTMTDMEALSRPLRRGVEWHAHLVGTIDRKGRIVNRSPAPRRRR